MNTRWAVLILTFVAAILRFYGYADWSLSNDELSAIARLRFETFSDLLYNGIRIDGHPPAAQTLLFYWTGMFGNTPASVRFPFVIAGILSVPMVYLVGKTWFSESAGLLSAATLTALQFPMLYSRICRPYALGLLFILIAAYFLGRILFSNKKPRALHALGFAVSLAMCVYSHYFAGLAAAVLAGAGLFFMNPQNAKYYIGGGLGSLVLFAPYAPFFLHQLGLGGVGQWLGKPDSEWLPEHFYYVLNESWLVVLLVVCIAILGIFYGRSERQFQVKRTVASLSVFLIPFVVGYVYSIKINPVLQHSTLLFSFPFGLLFLFGVTRFQTKLATIFSLVLLIGIAGDSLAIRQFYTTEHFGVFKELAEQAEDVQETHPNALMIADVHSPFYLDYYSDQESMFRLYDVAEFKALAEIHELAENPKVDVCYYAWSTKRQYDETKAVIKHHFPKFLKVGEHFNSGWILYGRSEVDVEPSFSFKGEKNNLWNLDPTGLENSDSTFSYILSDSVQFGPTFEYGIGNSQAFRNCKVLIEANAEVDSTRAMVVFAIDSAGVQIDWQGGKLMNQTVTGEYSAAVFEFQFPKGIPKNSNLKLYGWLPEKGETVKIRRFDVWLDQSRIPITSTSSN